MMFIGKHMERCYSNTPFLSAVIFDRSTPVLVPCVY